MVDDMADTAGCAEARDDLELLALDALEPDRAAAVGRHVEQCASCAAELVRLESVVGSVLHAARPVEPGAELTERILGGRTTPERAAEVGDEVDDRSAVPPASIARRPRRPGRVAAGAVGAAAAALLFAVVVGVLVGRASTSDSPPAEERAAVDGVRSGVLTGWGSEDTGTVVVTSGERPTLVVSLDQVRPGVTYGCQLRLADGTLVEVGSWTPSAADETAWAVSLDPDIADATEVVLTGPTGARVASAPLS